MRCLLTDSPQCKVFRVTKLRCAGAKRLTGWLTGGIDPEDGGTTSGYA
jgi:hypothetical protein